MKCKRKRKVNMIKVMMQQAKIKVDLKRCGKNQHKRQMNMIPIKAMWAEAMAQCVEILMNNHIYKFCNKIETTKKQR